MCDFKPGDRVEKYRGGTQMHPLSAPVGARGTVEAAGITIKGAPFITLREWPTGGVAKGHMASHWRRPERRCHPAQAWALMRTGLSLHDVAARSHDDPIMLDRDVWAWRAEKTRAATDQRASA